MAQSLSNLPIGAKVKFGKHQVNNETPWSIVWTVVAKNHSSTPAYPSNSVTLHATYSVDLRCFDAKEPTSPVSDRQANGNNNYVVSNIHSWLNSSAAAGSWHTGSDQAPANDYVTEGTGYVNRPGFLSLFSDKEYNSILNTSIRVVLPSYDRVGNDMYKDIVAKVFLPSVTEMGLEAENSIPEGANWGYYKDYTSRMTSVAPQAYANTLSNVRPATVNDGWSWWMRTPTYSRTDVAKIITTNGSMAQYNANLGFAGVRPAVNLAANVLVSDTIDSDGCYVTIFNAAPNTPSTITIPATIYGGKSNVISWGGAIDPDGDRVTYQLECSFNEGGYSQIYSGTSLNYTHLVPFGTYTVSYRVRAIDPSGESSTYATSVMRSVVNNNAPVISGTDANLGVKSSGFTGTYVVTDANNNAVTVTESIDGIQIRSLVATLGATITYGITDNTWLALSNGSHTLTIRATDGIDTSVRTYTFAKLVDSFTIRNSTPWASSTMPTRIMLVVTRNIPTTATFKAEVCNNGYDASPKWEDCTDAVKSGLVHVFSNTTKTATNWGVLIRVSVARNGATGACYVSAIGGNFE